MSTAPQAKDKPNSFQELILRLQSYQSAQGCAILKPYEMEMGQGRCTPPQCCALLRR